MVLDGLVLNFYKNQKRQDLVLRRRKDVEDKSKAFYYGAIVAFVLFVVAVCWWVLRSNDGNGHYNNIQEGLGNIESEQRRAEESIGRITGGIEQSEDSAERIRESVGRSDAIIETLADEFERNAGNVDAAIERIEDAESRNREVDARIEGGEKRISDGLRVNSESEQIFSRYESRDRSK